MDDESVWLKIGKSNKNITQWIKHNVYPIVITLASLAVLIFVPMIGSDASVGSIIPTDPQEAFLFWTLKGLTVGLNLAIFSAFRKQAKQDVKDHPNYIEACELLSKNKPEEYKPLSPVQFSVKQWLTKGVCLALSTAITTIALTNIILYYDFITAISCVISIILAIIFGLMNMASEEIYWTEDFLQYARTLDLSKGKKVLTEVVTDNADLRENKEKQ